MLSIVRNYRSEKLNLKDLNVLTIVALQSNNSTECQRNRATDRDKKRKRGGNESILILIQIQVNDGNKNKQHVFAFIEFV